MEISWKKRIVKWSVTSMSILVMGSNFTPLIANAADNLDSETTQISNTEENTYYLNTMFDEFISSFNDLNEEVREEKINELRLYADDAGNLLSNFEELDFSIYSRETLQPLVDYLVEIRLENSEELLNNEELENADLEGQDLNLNQSLETQTDSVVQASSSLVVSRLQGDNRFSTAVSISKSGWSSASTVIIVDSDGFADALAGVPLATALNAPILLSGNSSRNEITLSEISRLGAKKAIILGGEEAVSSSMEQSLKNKGISVERIAGSDRYETAGLIGSRVVSLTGAKEAIMVSGMDYADAMSVASFAARDGVPIYLTKKSSLAQEIKNASNSIKEWTIIGGGSAVSGTVGKDLQSRVTSISRIEGSDRYQTNQRVINHYQTTGDKVYVATGLDYADALTGSVLASKQGTGVILVKENDTVLTKVINFLESKSYSKLVIFGGNVALSSRVELSLSNLKITSDKPLIYVDPGHGGTDPGAVYGSLQEKNLNLSTANYLTSYLKNSGDYEVVMSRTSDVYPSLSDRSSEANELDADIFVSIHYNAMWGTLAGQASGIETFIYHSYYTSSRSDFQTNDTRIRESLRLADYVHPLLISRTGLSDRGIRGNNLHVVREPDMPSILVELGFLDHSGDRSVVQTASYQQKAALAIKDGIDKYYGN